MVQGCRRDGSSGLLSAALGRVDRANGDKIRMLLAKNVDQLKNNMMGEVMPFLAGNSLLQDANRLETGATALARAAAWSAEDMTTTHRAHEQMDALLLATLASSSSERLSRVIRTALAHGDTAGAVAAYSELAVNAGQERQGPGKSIAADIKSEVTVALESQWKAARDASDLPKLLGLLHVMAAAGLGGHACSSLTHHVKESVAAHIDGIASAVQSGASADTATVLVSSFRHIALMLEKLQHGVSSTFGDSAFQALTDEVLREADGQLGHTLSRNLDEVRRVAGQEIATGTYHGADVPRNTQQMEHLLDLVAGTCRAVQEFLQYIESKTATGLRTIVPSFAEVAKDLQNVYCQGEERRMSQAVKVSLATSGARGSYEISSVDEMFFIMETSCSRAFGTRNPEVAEFLLRAVDAQLLRVVDQIQRDLQRAIGGSVLSRALVSGIENGGQAHGHILALKEKLYDVFLCSFDRVPSSSDAIFQDILKKADVVDAAIERSVGLLSNLVAGQCDFDLIRRHPYSDVLSSGAHNTLDAPTFTSEWVAFLVQQLKTAAENVADGLDEHTLDIFMTKLGNTIASRVEEVVARKQLSELGALEFARDARVFVQELSRVLSHKLGLSMARLYDVTSMLALDTS